MRIALSGTHRAGKTTLAEAIADALAGYEFVPEPYALMEEEGYEFGEMPSVDDFEAMLERSIDLLTDAGRNQIFDRCPLDILAYLTTHQDAASFDRDAWMPRVLDAVKTLDLLVFVPIEDADIASVPRSEVRLRADVDAVLADVIPEAAADCGIEVITVAGSLPARLRHVLECVARHTR